MDQMIFVNFKTYAAASGHKALRLAEICDRVAGETGADIRIAVEAPDLRMIAQAVDIPVYAQHIDDVTPGSHTGWILPEAVAEAGAEGTLLNHSEHRLRTDVLQASVERARDVGLDVIICANNHDVADAVSEFDPDFVALEPPELIGGDVSVSTAEPELIEEAVASVPNLLVGAGVKTGQDVRIAAELGAHGVLLASGVTKADDPAAVLHDLIEH
jgi:triosephosphate isomerase